MFYILSQQQLFEYLFVEKYGPKPEIKKVTTDNKVQVAGIVFMDNDMQQWITSMIGTARIGNWASIDASSGLYRSGFCLLHSRFIDNEITVSIPESWTSNETRQTMDERHGPSTYNNFCTFNPNNIAWRWHAWDFQIGGNGVPQGNEFLYKGNRWWPQCRWALYWLVGGSTHQNVWLKNHRTSIYQLFICGTNSLIGSLLTRRIPCQGNVLLMTHWKMMLTSTMPSMVQTIVVLLYCNEFIHQPQKVPLLLVHHWLLPMTGGSQAPKRNRGWWMHRRRFIVPMSRIVQLHLNLLVSWKGWRLQQHKVDSPTN